MAGESQPGGTEQEGEAVAPAGDVMEMLYRICNITHPEIGKVLGWIDYSSVGQPRKRLHVKTENDPDPAKKMIQIQARWQNVKKTGNQLSVMSPKIASTTRLLMRSFL